MANIFDKYKLYLVLYNDEKKVILKVLIIYVNMNNHDINGKEK